VTAFGLQLNRFERILFGIVVVLACLLVAARLGTILVVSYLHYHR
jgi:hypothetical protein